MPTLTSALSSFSGILKRETLQMLDLMDKVALVTGRAVVSAVPLLKFSQREAPK